MALPGSARVMMAPGFARIASASLLYTRIRAAWNPGGTAPSGRVKLIPQRNCRWRDSAKLSGRPSIPVSRPRSSRMNRPGKAASISGVTIGKAAMGRSIRVAT
ncbi:hypothetical protein WR25_26479 [Diploscapter pachys]|uniref:Uncharacterized protein n=1 Tax=Diploscapter pachys TaxID=2018661 RepID=A0A2A2JZT1_9BILA|nr:hypothetical protein WR25_26479 [Diploscapter pachys]